MNPTKLLYYAALGWTIIMFIGCSIPGDGLSDTFTSQDKVLHIGIFGLFGYLWYWVGYRVWIVLVAGAVYGLLIEIWQGVMPINRSFDFYDILADAVGTVVGVGLAWLTRIVITSRRG